MRKGIEMSRSNVIKNWFQARKFALVRFPYCLWFLFIMLVSISGQAQKNWQIATNQAQWSPRYSFSALVFKDKMWVIGGVTADDVRQTDVWNSTDGATWTLAADTVSLLKRLGFTIIPFKGALYLLGGAIFETFGDVWRSENGAHWTQVTDSTGWWRQFHSAIVHNNKMWILGGYNENGKKCNDVWYSSDGITWKQATGAAGWSARIYHTSVSYDNKIWVIGGGFNEKDSWYSVDGKSWILATNNNLPQNIYLYNVATYANKMWFTGGQWNSSFYNTVYHSIDGIHWVNEYSGSWQARSFHGALEYKKKLWIMGGKGSSVPLNDVWYLNGPISIQNPPINRSINYTNITIESITQQRNRRTVQVNYALAKRLPIRISLFSITGRTITTLCNGTKEKGRHTVQWDCCDTKGRPVPKGYYIMHLFTPEDRVVKKMIVL